MICSTRGRRAAALCVRLALIDICGCNSLDPFFYVPMPAPLDADLLAGATAVPAALRQERRDIVAADGGMVDTYLLTHDPSDAADNTPSERHATTVLYCHGNAHNIASYARRVEALWQLGYTVAIFDYRGFGKSPGRPSEAGLYADARAVRAALQAEGATRLVLYGYSLGAAVCTQLAVEAPTAALVLESPFASAAELVDDNQTLEVPTSWYAEARYDTRGKIGAHRGALLVTHGEEDQFLQLRYGREVFDAAVGAAPRTFFVVPGADHNTVPCNLPAKRGGRPNDPCPNGFSDTYLAAVAAALDAGR